MSPCRRWPATLDGQCQPPVRRTRHRLRLCLLALGGRRQGDPAGRRPFRGSRCPGRRQRPNGVGVGQCAGLLLFGHSHHLSRYAPGGGVPAERVGGLRFENRPASLAAVVFQRLRRARRLPLVRRAVSQDDAALPRRLRPLSCSRPSRREAMFPTNRAAGSGWSATIRRCPTTSPPACWSTAASTVSTSREPDQPAPALAGHVPLHGLQDGQDPLVERPPRPGHDRRGGRTSSCSSTIAAKCSWCGPIRNATKNLRGRKSFGERSAGRPPPCIAAGCTFAAQPAWRVCTWGHRADWIAASRSRQCRPRRFPRAAGWT